MESCATGCEESVTEAMRPLAHACPSFLLLLFLLPVASAKNAVRNASHFVRRVGYTAGIYHTTLRRGIGGLFGERSELSRENGVGVGVGVWCAGDAAASRNSGKIMIVHGCQ